MAITRAMIMAAGLGARMRPLTDDRPKSLVTVAGKPLIDHALDRLVAAGVTMVVVNVHYHAAMLRAHLTARHDTEIRISDETDALLDTGGGAVRAMPHFEDQPFFILNSDSIWTERGTPALARMQQIWDCGKMDALLLLAALDRAMGYDGTGDFTLSPQGRITRPGPTPHKTSVFAYPGVQIVHPRLFADAPAGAFSTNRVWDKAIALGRLYGTVLDGMWLHVGTPKARQDAEDFLSARAEE